MKSDARRHPKTIRFAEILGIPLYSAWGLLEGLWLFTGEYAPTGALGNLSNKAIATAIEWDKNPDDLIDALVIAGFLDQRDCCKLHRLVIHDWDKHLQDRVRKHLARNKLQVSGFCPSFGGQSLPFSGQSLPTGTGTGNRNRNHTVPDHTGTGTVPPDDADAQFESPPDDDFPDSGFEGDEIGFPVPASGEAPGENLDPDDVAEIQRHVSDFHRILRLKTWDQCRTKEDKSRYRSDMSDLQNNIVPAVMMAKEIEAAKTMARACQTADRPLAALKARLKKQLDIDTKGPAGHSRAPPKTRSIM